MLLHGLDRIAQSLARRKVEADHGGRELSLVPDGELRVRLLPVGQHAERNLRAVARLDVEIVQRTGIGLEVLPNLHHHVVLVELRKDRGDLALAEGVVERVVHIGHGDAQPRRGIAIDHQLRAQALILQIAGHVGHDIFLAQLIDHLARVSRQLVLIRIFERILELGPADAIFHRQVLQRLQEELDAFDAFYLAAACAVNHFRRGDLALIERLQVDLNAARVQRRVGPIHADERRDVIHRRILQEAHPQASAGAAAMLVKLTVCGASLMPRITPVSCTGKKPLGTTMKSRAVATSVAMVTSSVMKR